MHDDILNIRLLIFYNILAELLHILFSFFHYPSSEICRALWLHFVYFGRHISIIASSVFLCHGLMAEFAHLHHFHIRTKKVSMFSSHCYSPTVPCHIHHHSPTGQTDFTNGSWVLIVEISWKFSSLWYWLEWSNHVIFLHMPWQWHCHGMCKIVTWLNNLLCESCMYVQKIWVISS